MSVNRSKPHLFVLPEDDANRQLANGFFLELNTKQIQILNEARGWKDVCDKFVSDHCAGMRKFTSRYMVLLMDFDNDSDRLRKVKADIPDDLTDRVFILGVRTEPEKLKKARMGSYENIGKAMADDCRNETQTIWGHELLNHNLIELTRLRKAICNFLFDP